MADSGINSWNEDYLDASGDALSGLMDERAMDAEMEYRQWQGRQETYNKARIQSLSDYGKPVWLEPEDSNIGEAVVGNNLYVFSLAGGDDPQNGSDVHCEHSVFDREEDCFGSPYFGDFTESVAWKDADPDDMKRLKDGMRKYVMAQTADMDVGVTCHLLPGTDKYQTMHPDDAEAVMLYEKWDSFTDPGAVTQAIYHNNRYRSADSQALMPFGHDDVMDILNSPYVESHFVPYVEQMDAIASVEAQLAWRGMDGSDAARGMEDTLARLSANGREEYRHILELIHPGDDGGGNGAAGGAEAGAAHKSRKRRLPEVNVPEDDEGTYGRRMPGVTFPCGPDPDDLEPER